MADEELLEDFKNGANFLRGLAGKLDSSDLLYFYARFKQANEGPCNAPKPGFFDFQGKPKWSAWKELGEMDKEQAMVEYLSRLEELEPDWRGHEAEGDRGWVSVSTLGRDTDPEIDSELKTIFDWVKESHIEMTRKGLEKITDINAKDESGLGLIHWASDRGSLEIVQLLIDLGADVNLLDDDQQTALHYACSCGHADVVKFLLQQNIDTSIKDSDGLLAIETTQEENIITLFR